MFMVATALKARIVLLSLCNGFHICLMNGFVMHQVGKVLIQEELGRLIWNNRIRVYKNDVFAMFLKNVCVMERITSVQNKQLNLN